MLKNYFKSAIHHIHRQKVYSLINILGLAVGIALFIIIALFVRDELSHDAFHSKLDRIYRVELGDVVVNNPRIGEFLDNSFPEIERTNRFGDRNLMVQYNEEKFSLRNCVFADSTVFDIFTFPLIKGDVNQPFRDPFDIVLTRSTARKIFGDANPIGKIIKVDRRLHYTVTAVARDLPPNSSIQANAFASFRSIPAIYDTPKERIWDSYNNFFTYILLREGTHAGHLEEKVNKRLMKRLLSEGDIDSKEAFAGQRLNLRPFSEVYFTQGLRFDNFVEHGKLSFVRIFMAIGIFILILACVNFINISTARSSLRAKEVGMRKVMGSSRSQLMVQHLTEAVVIALFATILGLVLAELMTPIFNNIIQAYVHIPYTLFFLLLVLGGGLLLGMLAGIYPALILSSKPLLSTIKSSHGKGAQGYSLRRVLTVFQYTISVVLIIATVVVFKQLDYVRTKDLGFDKERIVHYHADISTAKKDLLKQRLLKHPDISAVSYGNTLPGWVSMTQSFHTKEESYGLHSLPVDPDFFELFGMEIVRGRPFFEKGEMDMQAAYIVNEAAARLIGEEEIVGKPFRLWSRDEMGQIVGVVKDFHFRSLHHKIEPLVMYYRPEWCPRMFVKVQDEGLSSTIEDIKATTLDLVPDLSFNYSFVDDSFDRMYKKEERYGKLFGYFALIAIFIASLGLFGLALFSTNQRFKEISIRKVFGSSARQVLVLLTKQFSRWVLVANLIGWPVAWYFMDAWLQDFAYRTTLSWFVFAAGLVISLLIALLTVLFQSYRAANANPAEVLRDE
ncbi:MAG: ABC transporter permease [Bacteroidales bacterium]|nr:ABC transporter permease [Bacteroidales bacterium]